MSTNSKTEMVPFKADLPIEEMADKLANVVKQIKSRYGDGAPEIPELVDRILEPVIFTLFQAVLDRVDPEYKVNMNAMLGQMSQPSKEAFFVSGTDSVN